MERIGQELLQNSKEKLRRGESLEKGGVKARDLLGLLLRANTASDIPESQRMSDRDVLSR